MSRKLPNKQFQGTTLALRARLAPGPTALGGEGGLCGGYLLSRLRAAREKKSQINSQYMNPLRLFAEEVYYRLYEIRDVPEAPLRGTAG